MYRDTKKGFWLNTVWWGVSVHGLIISGIAWQTDHWYRLGQKSFRGSQD